MKRFFGMMPSSEVELQKSFEDSLGYRINLEAGPNGWTVMYEDGSTDYKDAVATSEANLDEAVSHLKKTIPDAEEIHEEYGEEE